MSDRKLYDVRGIELEIGQVVAYGRSVGQSVSISMAEVVGLDPYPQETQTHLAYSYDRVMIKYLFETFGTRVNPDRPVKVMPERVMVITGVPD